VTDTVGKQITPLDYSGALAAQFAAAFSVHYFSIAGIPVSTSQAVVGGVLGVGLTGGIRAVSTRKLQGIFLGWVLTPVGAALLSATLFHLFFT
jgi:PiT family inorganic phosphate transporter